MAEDFTNTAPPELEAKFWRLYRDFFDMAERRRLSAWSKKWRYSRHRAGSRSDFARLGESAISHLGSLGLLAQLAQVRDGPTGGRRPTGHRHDRR